MLDFFTIFSKSGLVLWYYTFQGVKTNFSEPINAFIKNVVLQERGGASPFIHGKHQMKYLLDNEYELIFVVGYQSILTLSYVDKLINDVHRSFRDKYCQKLRSGTLAMIRSEFEYMDEFNLLHKAAEGTKSKPRQMKTFGESKKSKKNVGSMIMNKKEEHSSPGGKQRPNGSVKSESRHTTPTASPVPTRTREVEPPAPVIDDEGDSDEVAKRREEFFKRNKKQGKPGQLGKGKKEQKEEKKKGKQKRVWDQGGTNKDHAVLDYSSEKSAPVHVNGNGHVDSVTEVTEEERNWAGASKDIQDLEIEDGGQDGAPETAPENRASSNIFGMFRDLVGSKALTKEALEPVLNTMRDHLIGKNVAADIAEKMCDSVSTKLEGKVLGTFSTIASTVKQSLHDTCVQILTPKRRVDILRDVLEAQRNRRPYVITFCGVNGVGKSTNLAKISFWLMENGFRVLIAACDTFRAGAVEQLRTHAARLNSLHPVKVKGGQPSALLYEKGYGKDAAGIAMQAINAAREQRYDVVMVDTAGRMQDNEPLMRALAKLITVNTPDLTLFVGEALVGNEAVDQLQKFNQALADHSNVAKPRCIDGIVLTKFDTIDDKVGAAISMTYTTGQPIVFVGTGQSYPDLRSLNAKAVVSALLK